MRFLAPIRLFLLGLPMLFLAGAVNGPAAADDGERLLTVDHYVRTKSTVPAITGQPAQIYVRERAKTATVARGGAIGDRVVLFVHGAGTPAEVAFAVPYQAYRSLPSLPLPAF